MRITEPVPQLQPNPMFHGAESVRIEQQNHIIDQIKGIEGVEVLSGTTTTLNTSSEHLPVAVNKDSGINVEQKLLGYVVAGDTTFSIIKASIIDSDESHIVIGKIDPKGEERPSLYGVVDRDNSIQIGRNSDQSLGTEVSRSHLTINYTDNGVEITDLQSSNGTRVLSGEVLSNPAGAEENRYKLSALGVARGIFRSKSSKQEASSSGQNDLVNLNSWCVKSGDVRSAIDEVEAPPLENIRPGQYDYDHKFSVTAYTSLIEGLGDKEKSAIKEVMFKGTFEGVHIDVLEPVQRSASEVVRGRIQFARIYKENPLEAEMLAKDQVAGFHGTRSAALAGILKKGYIGSGRHLRDQEAFVFSGEHIYQSEKGQGSISFSNISGLDSGALGYSGKETKHRTFEELSNELQKAREWLRTFRDTEKGSTSRMSDTQDAIINEQARSLKYMIDNPDSLEAQLSLNDFPVVITISRDGLDRTEKSYENWPDGRINRGGLVLGTGGMSEYQLMAEKVAKESIPLILVPKEEVNNVRELCKQYGFTNTRVSDIETYQKASTRIYF